MRTATVVSLLVAGGVAAASANGAVAAPVNASEASVATHTRVNTNAAFPCQHIFLNVDFPRNDIGSAPAHYNNPGGAIQCFDLCRARCDCHAATWTIFNSGTCWFKSAAGDGVWVPTPQLGFGAPPPTSFVLGPLPDANWHCEPMYKPIYNCDLPGDDITNVRGGSLNDCFQPCLAAGRCTRVTWTAYNGGTCWFKQADHGDCVATPDAHSALVSVPW